MHNPEARESAQQQAGARKSYHSPELKLHGTVQEQTLAGPQPPTGTFDGTGYS